MAGTLLLFAIVRTLHGAPFGATTVSNSTVAIDVLHPSRRAEGIGYYGLSNNIATAISPTVALLLFESYNNYDLLFWVAFATALIGLTSTALVKVNEREISKPKQPLSLDRFILLKGWRQGLAMICYSFSYGVLATYIAIYGKDELGITGGTGLFFMLLAMGLALSRIVGGRKLRQGKVTQNASLGIAVSLVGYLIFAAVHNQWGWPYVPSLSDYVYQPCGEFTAWHSQLYPAGFVGYRHWTWYFGWWHCCRTYKLSRHILDCVGRKCRGRCYLLPLCPQALPAKPTKIKKAANEMVSSLFFCL